MRRCRSTFAARHFSGGSGGRFSAFRPAKRAPTPTWRARLAGRRRSAPLRAPVRPIRSASSCRATGSWPRTARLADTVGVRTAKRACWRPRPGLKAHVSGGRQSEVESAPVRAAWRKDLEHVLNTFVADHRGLRTGRMFGLPGAYAGRKLFACVLPGRPDGQAPVRCTRRCARPRRDIRGHRWVAACASGCCSAPSRRRPRRVLPFLEIAARHAAQLATSGPAAMSPARSHARARFAADAAAQPEAPA